MKPTVFIHTNHKQMVGARVSAYSMVRNSWNRDKFAVEIIALSDFPALHRRQGQIYPREGRRTTWDNEDLQSFTPLRFLPPQLMNYQGRAIVTDPDVFAVGDIHDLLTRDMGGKAILARKIAPKDGRPPCYASSVMLLDCAKLRHWRWEQQIDEMFAGARDYRPWMSLLLEPDDAIGPLEEAWNSFDALGPETKLLHNTGRASQPWKTGLPIDFMPKIVAGRQPRKWGIIPRPWISRIRAALSGSASTRIYRPHPDPNQERFFFSLLRECLEQGIVTEEILCAEIGKRHLRPDAFTVMDRLATG
ncbi:hypothetical protein [Rhodospirillaceae bacterium SYSU D60014]|uniref:hypothetical protein n=1 Tax=Virgifigura deserti TaxID=2268457 RepID=UPI000E6618EA